MRPNPNHRLLLLFSPRAHLPLAIGPLWLYYWLLLFPLILLCPFPGAAATPDDLIEFIFQQQKICASPFSDAQWVPVLDLCEVVCDDEREICVENDEMKQRCSKLPEECVRAWQAKRDSDISRAEVQKVHEDAKTSTSTATTTTTTPRPTTTAANRPTTTKTSSKVVVRDSKKQRPKTTTTTVTVPVGRARSKKQLGDKNQRRQQLSTAAGGAQEEEKTATFVRVKVVATEEKQQQPNERKRAPTTGERKLAEKMNRKLAGRNNINPTPGANKGQRQTRGRHQFSHQRRLAWWPDYELD